MVETDFASNTYLPPTRSWVEEGSILTQGGLSQVSTQEPICSYIQARAHVEPTTQGHQTTPR